MHSCEHRVTLYATLTSLQIDIPSDIQQKALRMSQRYMSGKDVNPNLFDEAQYCVFKELLPYWAGFMRNYKEPEDLKKVPRKAPTSTRRHLQVSSLGFSNSS